MIFSPCLLDLIPFSRSLRLNPKPVPLPDPFYTSPLFPCKHAHTRPGFHFCLSPWLPSSCLLARAWPGICTKQLLRTTLNLSLVCCLRFGAQALASRLTNWTRDAMASLARHVVTDAMCPKAYRPPTAGLAAFAIRQHPSRLAAARSSKHLQSSKEISGLATRTLSSCFAMLMAPVRDSDLSGAGLLIGRFRCMPWLLLEQPVLEHVRYA